MHSKKSHNLSEIFLLIFLYEIANYIQTTFIVYIIY